jgi:hypothetical protein
MSREEAVLTIQDTQTVAPECTHHWVIDTPSGPVSHGTCKRCGEIRDFPNYVENTPYWEDELDRAAPKSPVGDRAARGVAEE